MLSFTRVLTALAIVSGVAFLATPAQGTPLPSEEGNSTSSIVARGMSGDGTFYATGLGACGVTNNDGQLIAAMAHATFDAFPGAVAGNPNKNPICKKKVKATYKGKSVTVAITDRCGGCAGAGDLDFSPAAFNKLANPSTGRIHGVKWEYV